MQPNLFPFANQLITRPEKEKLLGQHAKVVWLTGLSGAGKTTIALGLEKLLHRAGLENRESIVFHLITLLKTETRYKQTIMQHINQFCHKWR